MNADETDQSQRLVVCLVIDETASERFPAALRYLQIGLMDEAVDVVLVAPQDERSNWLATGPTQLLTYRSHGWPLAHWSRRNITNMVAEKALALKSDSPILIHGLTPGCAALAADISAAIEGPLLLSIWSLSDALDQHFGHQVDRAEMILAPSDRIARALTGRISIQRPLEVISLGLPAASEIAAFRSDDRSPTIVFAGSLLEDTGLESMLRAIRRVMQKQPNLLVFLMGKGPGEASLRRLTVELGISEQVIFTGRIDNLRPALESADIFCLPGAGEPYREELIQAMASGLAIVAAEPSPYEGLEHGRTALLCSGDAEAGMAEQMMSLIINHDESRRLAAGARAYAVSNNSVARMVAAHARVYRQLDRRERTFTISERV